MRKFGRVVYNTKVKAGKLAVKHDLKGKGLRVLKMMKTQTRKYGPVVAKKGKQGGMVLWSGVKDFQQGYKEKKRVRSLPLLHI